MRFQRFVFSAVLFILGLPVLAHTVNHTERLRVLRSHGFNPKVIYDIGAYTGGWTKEIRSVFSDAQFFMFEANQAHRASLQRVGVPFFMYALGDKEEQRVFYKVDGSGDSLLREQTWIYEPGHCREEFIPVKTLHSVVYDENIPLPDLVKIDVQGAEKMVIEGGYEVLCNAEVMILETKILQYNEGAPFLLEILHLLDDLGYQAIDIIELHYLPTQELNEIDVLFVKKDSPLFKKGLLVKRC